MANLKIRVRGAEAGNEINLQKLRERVTGLVKNRLGGGYGRGSMGVKWEVSTQFTSEKR